MLEIRVVNTVPVGDVGAQQRQQATPQHHQESRPPEEAEQPRGEGQPNDDVIDRAIAAGRPGDREEDQVGQVVEDDP